ncbi:MAG: radical SAM protein [Theionarchaea archaeon]|nr:radical SAM protein [Theionarchaea archaeon]
MIFTPEIYTILLGEKATFLRIRKEPFGCSVFDTAITYETNRSFYYILKKIIEGTSSTLIEDIMTDFGIGEADAIQGYREFIAFCTKKKWIEHETDVTRVTLLSHDVLPPLTIDSSYNMAPNSIDFHITLRCNLACPHCNLYERIRDERYDPELTTHQWFHILDELDENGCMQILITGGEPSLREDLFDVIDYAFNHTHLYIIINTNGTLWTEEQVKEFIRKTGKRGKIIISLDGHTPETYGKARKLKDGTSASDLFHHVISTAQWVEIHGGDVGFNFVLSRATYAHSLDTARWALDTFPSSNFNVLRFDVTNETKKGLDLTYKEWKQWIYGATPLKEQYDGRFGLSLACGGELYFPMRNDKEILKIWKNNIVTPLSSRMYRERRDIGCHAATTDISIGPDGTLFGCGLYTDHDAWYVGDLQSDSLYDIWHHGKHIKKFRNIRVKDLHTSCETCPILGVCGGGCRGRAMVATGDMYGPDPYCPYAWRKSDDKGSL